jgi:Protein of unknown function (DUF4232)
MRFQRICEPTARPAARDRLIAVRGRTAVTGVLAAAACGLAVTACGSQASTGASPTATSSASAVVTECPASQLSVTLTDTGAVGGQAGGYLKFTDEGRTSCRMTGWPVVVALTAAGQATSAQHAESTMFGAWRYAAPLPVVVLRPGDSAYAVVAAGDEPAGRSTHCPEPYVRLRVGPPGRPGRVTISAWLPGARSYLPSCTAIDGSPTAVISAITTLSHLPGAGTGREQDAM